MRRAGVGRRGGDLFGTSGARYGAATLLVLGAGLFGFAASRRRNQR